MTPNPQGSEAELTADIDAKTKAHAAAMRSGDEAAAADIAKELIELRGRRQALRGGGTT